MPVSGRAQGPPLDGDVETWSQQTNRWVLVPGAQVATGLSGAVYLSNPVFGAYLDGVHDDSSAWAAAVAATPPGGTLVLPSRPILLATNQAPNQPINIVGSGIWCLVNFGYSSAGWNIGNYGSYFGGTVIYFTSTSGTALALGPPTANQTNQSTIENVMLLGPGTGTGTGLLLQNMVPPYLGGGVLVANFHDGIICNSLESCSADAFKTRGCFNGIALTNATNNCVLNGWGSDTSSGVGLNVPAAGAQGTVLYAFESQANTGTVATIAGGDGLTIGEGSYFENVGATAGILISGTTVYISGIIRGTPADTLTVSGGVVTMTASRGSPAISVTGGNLYSIGDIGPTPTVTGGFWFRLMPAPGTTNNLSNGIAIPAGQLYQLNGPNDNTSAISRDVGTGDTIIGTGSGWVRVANLNFSASTTGTTAPGAGGAGALPATPLGYITVQIAGVARRIAYY